MIDIVKDEPGCNVNRGCEQSAWWAGLMTDIKYRVEKTVKRRNDETS